MKKIKFLGIFLFSLLFLTAGCGGGDDDEGTSTVLPEGEVNSGPVLNIQHAGRSRSNIYQIDDEISGQVSLSFVKDKVIEGVGYGMYESSTIAIGHASIQSNTDQEIVFKIQGRMTDSCEMEITIIEDRLPGIKTSGYSFDNYPRRGRPGEMSVEAYELIPGSEFIEGTFHIPFTGALFTVKTTRDEYKWTWTFQILGVDEHEEVHGCTFSEK